MNKKERIAQGIKSVVATMMDRVMNKVLVEDPFIEEHHHAAKPLYAALVPDEIFKGSHFERRFVTPFGGVWEKLAVVVATEMHGDCKQGFTIDGMIGKERLRRIQATLNQLEHSTAKLRSRKKPNWTEELKYILEGGGELVPCPVTCDLLVESNVTRKTYAFELKGPLPNSDQTKVSKEKMFKLLAMQPQKVDFAYYALPYNPYGKKEDYAWSFPLRWFNMKEDPSVLIGDEFWNLIGGTDAYHTFISEINTLGKGYRDRIYREFLGIEPPEDTHHALLK
ncbi:MAG: TdeIII family type II restriction endonuclease [Kiritimatiellae bacterium]|nr:TdeIII family type II restriction endonuclease [Kiritimatiellia bacterium]